ncbi:Agmatinase [uncultured delta proteobacterium]|uniref:Agmatinase n=1 Tax=uncultured delta proteobacterium TaxID=34034 RepID=A0A212KBC0_9DELT|nr:Agmatinase [uncultured delta proteobacterium]
MTRFLASELPDLPPEDCLFHVIPVPYEASVSYGGGTQDGPAAILEASSQLEVWTGEINPGEQGIHTWPAVDCTGEAPAVMDAIASATAKALASRGNAIPVLLGGEHSITFGALRALRDHYGLFGVIQFDAHADLRDTYGGNKHSHACVMRRATDDLGLPLFQFGVRSLSPEEVVYRKARAIPHLDAREFARRGGTAWLKDERGPVLPATFPRRVFLTFDVDALDAGIMPATGTPEPGGLTWWESLALVRRALAGRECIGFDVTETAPIETFTAPTFTAARLTYELMAEVCISRGA